MSRVSVSIWAEDRSRLDSNTMREGTVQLATMMHLTTRRGRNLHRTS